MNPLRIPLFVLAVLWSLSAPSFALAQDSNAPAPSPSASSLDLLPPPPPPLPPSAPGQGRRAGGGLAYSPESLPQIYLNQNASLSIWNSEEQMNYFYVNKFIQSAGFGGVRMTVPTMTIDPSIWLVLGQEIELDGAKITAAETFKIDHLELIGIAKHDPPVAFFINRHSAFLINQARQTTPSRFSKPQTISSTRPLTDFEQTALAAIKAGKEVADQPQPDGSLLVVGAVRAQAACIQCHDTYKAGDALGAFSYHLTKISLLDKTPSLPSTRGPSVPLSTAMPAAQ